MHTPMNSDVKKEQGVGLAASSVAGCFFTSWPSAKAWSVIPEFSLEGEQQQLLLQPGRLLLSLKTHWSGGCIVTERSISVLTNGSFRWHLKKKKNSRRTSAWRCFRHTRKLKLDHKSSFQIYGSILQLYRTEDSFLSFAAGNSDLWQLPLIHSRFFRFMAGLFRFLTPASNLWSLPIFFYFIDNKENI